jgi:hypothetical protein
VDRIVRKERVDRNIELLKSILGGGNVWKWLFTRNSL